MEAANGSNGAIGRANSSAVLWLDDPRCTDVSLVGNKGANLARVRSRGFDVPNGFCISTEAMEAGEDEYEEPVRQALRSLRSPWVARSSSTAEDRKNLAFPGLFCTVVDIADVHSLFEEVRKIDISTKSELVSAYAGHHGVDTNEVRMAVLVQSLVPATAAGVAFSRHPVTDAPQIVIESNFGLGETVVDGSIIPDSFVLDESGMIAERTTGSKEQKVVPTTHQARTRRVKTSLIERASLSLNDSQVLAVADVTRRLEAELEVPVDVEWAFVGEQLRILQARPITTGQGTDRAADSA